MATTTFKRMTGMLAIAACAAVSNASFAQEEDLSFSLSMNHDAFFGTNPFLGAAYSTDSGYDLTAYGIQWGTGTGSQWGQWTEFGVGVGFEALDGDLYINPQIGFTFGSLLSSGAAEDGVIGDGIVPNLTMTYGTDDYEGQLYFGYYSDLEDNAPETGATNEYVHYWVNFGKKFGKYFSAGLHFEELYLSGGRNIPDSVDGYQWIGPYFQVAHGNAGLRFSFGDDLTDDATSFSDNDFYKLQFFFNF
jgi:hypothetical protein